MYWDAIEIKPQSHLTLYVRFEDGTAGIVRFLPEHLTGVFTPLNCDDFFTRAP